MTEQQIIEAEAISRTLLFEWYSAVTDSVKVRHNEDPHQFPEEWAMRQRGRLAKEHAEFKARLDKLFS